MTTLPEDILGEVIGFLPLRLIARLSICSKSLAGDSAWKHLTHLTLPLSEDYGNSVYHHRSDITSQCLQHLSSLPQKRSKMFLRRLRSISINLDSSIMHILSPFTVLLGILLERTESFSLRAVAPLHNPASGDLKLLTGSLQTKWLKHLSIVGHIPRTFTDAIQGRRWVKLETLHLEVEVLFSFTAPNLKRFTLRSEFFGKDVAERFEYLRTIISQCDQLELLDVPESILRHSSSGNLMNLSRAEDVFRLFSRLGINMWKIRVGGLRIWEICCDLGKPVSTDLIRECHHKDDPIEYILPKIEGLLIDHFIVGTSLPTATSATFHQLLVENLQTLPQYPGSVPWNVLKALVYVIASFQNSPEDANSWFDVFTKLLPFCDVPLETLVHHIFDSRRGAEKLWVLQDWIKLVLKDEKSIPPELILDQFAAMMTHPNIHDLYLRLPESFMLVWSHPLFPSRLRHRPTGFIEDSEVLSTIRLWTMQDLHFNWYDLIPVLYRALELNAVCYCGAIQNWGVLFMPPHPNDPPNLVEAKMILVSRFLESFNNGTEHLLIGLSWQQNQSFDEVVLLHSAWLESFPDHGCPQFLMQKLWTGMVGFNVDAGAQMHRFLRTLETTVHYPDCLPLPGEIPLLMVNPEAAYHHIMKYLESSTCPLSKADRGAAKANASYLLGLPVVLHDEQHPVIRIQQHLSSTETWNFANVLQILKEHANQPRLLQGVSSDGRNLIDILFSGDRTDPFGAAWSAHLHQDMPWARDVFDLLISQGCWTSCNVRLITYAFLSGSSIPVLDSICQRYKRVGDEDDLADIGFLWMAFMLTSRARRFGTTSFCLQQLAYIWTISQPDSIDAVMQMMNLTKSLETLVHNRKIFIPWIQAFLAPCCQHVPTVIEEFLMVVFGLPQWEDALKSGVGKEFFDTVMAVPDRTLDAVRQVGRTPLFEGGVQSGCIDHISAMSGYEEYSPEEQKWSYMTGAIVFVPLRQNSALLLRLIERMREDTNKYSPELRNLLEAIAGFT